MKNYLCILKVANVILLYYLIFVIWTYLYYCSITSHSFSWPCFSFLLSCCVHSLWMLTSNPFLFFLLFIITSSLFLSSLFLCSRLRSQCSSLQSLVLLLLSCLVLLLNNIPWYYSPLPSHRLSMISSLCVITLKIFEIKLYNTVCENC